ncbi:MAG TPA: DUF6428 family protein [Flavobacteriaceae bacterium]|nr:DUF6428 family protein [Flavobacteriaceae bacterium]
MKTQELFKLLDQHQNKSLVFEYAQNQFVGANYHITEVKHLTIDSVDCGSKTNFWKETIVQLWESPKEIGKTEYMGVDKALSILKKVGKVKPYDFDAEIKFEYSNATFNTAQLFVDNYETNGETLIVKLAVEKTNCKAKDECCTPEVLEAVTSEIEPCCASDGTCC